MPENSRFPHLIFCAILFITITTGIIYPNKAYCVEQRKYPKIGKWKPLRDIEIYTPENLFDYINGAAELYLSYDLKQLDVVYYRNRQKQEITLEVYTHISPLHAFGIYSQERPADGQYVDIGAESYITGSGLYILTGRHYVKIHTYDLPDHQNEILTEFARRIVDFLGNNTTLPATITVFPEKNLRPKSIQFVAENLLGYSFFDEGFQAYYDMGDESCRLFIIKKNSIKEANNLFDQYIFHIRHAPRIPGSDEYNINDPYHGQGIIRKYKHYVFGGFGSGNIEKLLDEMKLNF